MMDQDEFSQKLWEYLKKRLDGLESTLDGLVDQFGPISEIGHGYGELVMFYDYMVECHKDMIVSMMNNEDKYATAIKLAADAWRTRGMMHTEMNKKLIYIDVISEN